MKKTYNRLALQGAYMILMLCAGYVFLTQVPYREWMQERLIATFAARGIVITSMQIDTLLPNGLEVSDISVIEPSELSIGLARIDIFRRTVEIENLVVPESWNGKTMTYQASLKLVKDGDRLVTAGEFRGEPDSVVSHFNLYAPPNNQRESVLHLDDFSFSYAGGTVSVGNVDLSMAKSVPIPMEVKLSQLQLGPLLQQLLHPEARATGTFSGVVPLLYNQGLITLKGMNLVTLQPGYIRIPPELLPATNDQEMMLRDALGNFNYSKAHLYAAVLDAAGKTPLMLELTGANPAMHGSNEIKLSVNLGTGVLDLLNQQLLLLPTP